MRTLSKKMYNGCKSCNQGYGELRFIGCLGSSVFLGILGLVEFTGFYMSDWIYTSLPGS